MRANLGQAARSKISYLFIISFLLTTHKSQICPVFFFPVRNHTQRIESDPSLELSRIIRKFPSVNGQKIHWLVTILARNHETTRPGKQLLCELNGSLAGRERQQSTIIRITRQ